jgi:predicted nucleic acid-binding Zn ribbon protein
MPTYVYKFVETGETIEVQQGFHDDPLTEATHPVTGAVLAVKKVFQPVGISFKGSGFYKTDSRSGSSKSSAGSSTSTASESSTTSTTDSGSAPAATPSTPASSAPAASTPAASTPKTTSTP